MRLDLTTIALSLCLVAPAATAQIWTLPAPTEEVGSHFGTAVALDGETAVVGASGVDVCGDDSGAAYIFKRGSAGSFEQVASLADGDCRAGRFFGREVAIAGGVAAVAAGGMTSRPGETNAVHLFERVSDDRWEEVQILHPPRGDRGVFGAAIALGNQFLVIASAGDTAGGAYHGAALVYERDHEGGWNLVQTLEPGGNVDGAVFGSHVATDGETIVVTASPYGRHASGSVFVFERDGDGEWRGTAQLTGFRSQTVRADVSGGLLIVGEPLAGSGAIGQVAVFGRRADGHWRRQNTLIADVPYANGAFGSLVALSRSDAGPRILAVGYTEQLGRQTNIDRVVHVFGYDREQGWSQRQILDLGDWAFGMAVAVDGRTALVGRAADHVPGSAYAINLLD